MPLHWLFLAVKCCKPIKTRQHFATGYDGTSRWMEFSSLIMWFSAPRPTFILNGFHQCFTKAVENGTALFQLHSMDHVEACRYYQYCLTSCTVALFGVSLSFSLLMGFRIEINVLSDYVCLSLRLSVCLSVCPSVCLCLCASSCSSQRGSLQGETISHRVLDDDDDNGDGYIVFLYVKSFRCENRWPVTLSSTLLLNKARLWLHLLMNAADKSITNAICVASRYFEIIFGIYTRCQQIDCLFF